MLCERRLASQQHLAGESGLPPAEPSCGLEPPGPSPYCLLEHAYDLEAGRPEQRPVKAPGSEACGPRPIEFCGRRLGQRLARTPSNLGRALVAFIAALVLFHAASCGLFFCVRIPTPLDGYFGGYLPDPVLRRAPHVITADPASDVLPSLVPRIIHQVYRLQSPPSKFEPLIESWAVLNEGWELRRYSEDSASEFVRREFPEYLEAYRMLPSWADKVDLFKVLVVLRLGGVFADINTEARRPLDDIILPKDTLVVGWEAVLPSAVAGFSGGMISEAVFAGAPGHPALREVADSFSQAAQLQAANRTAARGGKGGSTWTDVLLRQAVKHPVAEYDPWGVRILAGVVFGLRKADLKHVYPFETQVAVIDHELEVLREPRGADGGRGLPYLAARVGTWLWPSARRPVSLSDGPRPVPSLRPVSAFWEPPFTILSYAEDGTAGGAAADMLTTYGMWQPTLAPNRNPNVVEAVVGPLALHYLQGRVLLDIGAGNGFFTLAAAARGHAVVAVELGDVLHRGLAASVRYNGFQHNVTVVQAAAGEVAERACVAAQGGAENEELERGYGSPQVHALEGEACARFTRRQPTADLVPPGTAIGAVRVSVAGWEGRVAAGLAPLLVEQRPWVVLLELFPLAMARVEGRQDAAVQLLQSLYNMGYTDVSHSGYVCDERWANVTAAVRAQASLDARAAAALAKQPTWCRVGPDQFGVLALAAKEGVPENVLLAYKPERRVADPANEHVPQGQQERDEALLHHPDAVRAAAAAAAGDEARAAPPAEVDAGGGGAGGGLRADATGPSRSGGGAARLQEPAPGLDDT